MTDSAGAAPAAAARGALDRVLRAFLQKLGPFAPPGAPLVLYTLLIEGAVVGPDGAVEAEGEGVLVGPLGLGGAVAAHPGHAPELADLVERGGGGNIVIVTCHIAASGGPDGADGYTHYAIVRDA